MADGVVIFDVELDSSGLSGQLGGLGSKLAKGAAVAAAGAAVGKGFSAAIGAGMNFESIMSKVKALSDATDSQMAELTQSAKDWGASTAFSASEVGQAFTYMAQAGWDTSSMLAGIGPILNLAAADGLDLATTSDIVTDSLTAFGLTAGDTAKYADVLATAAAASNTNVHMMGETFKYAAPVAGALGYSVQDVALAVGLMANAGIKGSQAGTALRGVLTRMAKPTKQSQQAMDALGVSLTRADGSMKPLSQVMGELREGFAGLTEEQQASYAAMLAGQEGMSGLLAIVNASQDDYDELAAAIENSKGSAERMAKTMMDNLAGDVEEFKGAAETLALEFYETFSEGLRKATQTGTGIIEKLTEGLKTGDLSGAFESILKTDVPAIATSIGEKLGAALANLPEMATAAGNIVAALAVGIAKAIPRIATGIWSSLSLHLRGKDLDIEVIAKIDEATKTLDTLDSDIQALKTKYTTDMIEINLDAKNAEALIAELATLQGKEILTEAESLRMKEITQSLVNIYSQLGSYVGDTGVLNLEAGAVANLVAQYQALAREKAAANYLSGVAGEYAAAELAHKELELQLASLIEQNDAYEKRLKIFNELSDDANTSAMAFQNMFTGGGEAVDLATVEQALAVFQKYHELAGSLDGLTSQGIDLSQLFGANGEMLDAATIQGNVDALVELQSALFLIKSFGSDMAASTTINEGGLVTEIATVTATLETHAQTLETAAQKYQDALKLVDQYLGDGAAESITDSAEKASEALESAGETTNAADAELPKQAQEIVEATTTAIEEGQEAVEQEMSELAKTLTEAINTALTADSAEGGTSAEDKLLLMGAAMAEAIALGINTGATAVTTALMALFSPPEEASAKDMATHAANWVKAFNDALTAAFSGEESGGKGGEKTDGKSFLQTLLDGLFGGEEQTAALTQQMTTIGAQMKAALMAGFNGGGEAGAEGGVGADGGAATDEMTTLGTQLAQAVATGISNGSGDISSEMKSAIDSAKKAVDIQAFVNLGLQISQGVARGIKQGSGAIALALIAAIKNALAEGLEAAKINSPSRLFRDELGRWIPAGAAEGIEMNAWQMREATRQMVLDSVPSLNGFGRRVAAGMDFGFVNSRLAHKAYMAGFEPVQEINFNVPVQTPDEFAQTVELFMSYGLEADY